VMMVLGLIAVSALLFGPTLWLDFLRHTVSHAGHLGVMERWFFAGVGPAMGYGMWGWIAFAAIGALLLMRNVNVFTAATATFLISPYGFHYDMPVACLGFGLMIYTHWQEMPIQHRIPVAIGFLSPVIAISGVWWMPPLLGWALWAQTKYESAGELRACFSRQAVDDCVQ